LENLNFKEKLNFNEFPPISLEEWEGVIESDLKGKDYKDALQWESGEGVNILPFYRKEHLKDLEQSPFPVRTSASWDIIEPITGTDPKKANELALHALRNGSTGLYFLLKADSISSKQDLELLLEDIQIEFITLKFGAGLSTPGIVKWLQSICENRGILNKDLNVYFSFDPFSSAIRSGKLLDSDSLQQMVSRFGDLFSFMVSDSSVYANSGATIIQQIAFTLASANEFLGMNEKNAQKLYFNFASGPNYFPEIAKIRAFQLMWTQVLKEYGIQESSNPVHSETSFWNKSKTDAHNNMLRATTEAMSAALAGCDVMTVHPYNAHFEDPSGFSSRIARNVQLILQEEAYLDKVADPGAGSYYIEVLTNKISEESWALFQKIEGKGGFYECLKEGFIQNEIMKSQKEKISAYKDKEKVLVGVNKYQPDEIQKSQSNIQNFADFEFADTSFSDIKKVEPLNIEAELQKGNA
jgi:methylmalonyl-CoA mutase